MNDGGVMSITDLTEQIICEWICADAKTRADVLSVLRLYAIVKARQLPPLYRGPLSAKVQ